jgi:hypothetical protein
MTQPSALDEFHAHQRHLAAFHEAGHAVAAVARGGLLLSVSIESKSSWQDGETGFRCHEKDRTFIAFAGPWAESIEEWGERPRNGVDEHGHTFDDYLRTSMTVSVGDLQVYDPDFDIAELSYAMFSPGSTPPTVSLARAAPWYDELELLWDAMQSVADALLRGDEPTHKWVASLFDDEGSPFAVEPGQDNRVV